MDTCIGNRFNSSATYPLLIPIVLCVLCVACKNEGNIGLDNENPGLGVSMIDTLSIESSTFLLDPLPTAGTGTMLVGGTRNDAWGRIDVSSYFRVSNEGVDVSQIPSDAVYDSLSIRLFYNGYYSGDTTAGMTVAIHRLNEDLELTELSVALEDDEYPVFVSGATLWSDKKFAYGDEFGVTTFMPRPNTVTDTVVLRMNDVLGRALFDMAVQQDARIINLEDFTDFIKGFVLVSKGERECVIGFRDSVALNVHYSYERQVDGMRVSDTLKFTMGSTAYQYNQVEVDRQGTVLEALSYEHQEVSASKTNNRTYLQGASGLVTRIRMPAVLQFVNGGNLVVNKAQLIVETDQPVDSWFPPPTSLVMMVANAYGTPISILNSSYQNVQQVVNYQPASLAGGAGRGKYVFDLTEYVSNMQKNPTNEYESLLLSLPTNGLTSAVDHLIIADNGDRPAIKLHVIYTKY